MGSEMCIRDRIRRIPEELFSTWGSDGVSATLRRQLLLGVFHNLCKGYAAIDAQGKFSILTAGSTRYIIPVSITAVKAHHQAALLIVLYYHGAGMHTVIKGLVVVNDRRRSTLCLKRHTTNGYSIGTAPSLLLFIYLLSFRSRPKLSYSYLMDTNTN